MTVASGAGRRGVPARSAALGALVGVAGVVGVAVFVASVSTNRDEAHRYGWTWDSSPDLVTSDPEAVVARMTGDPDLAAVADVTCGALGADGTTLYACAFNDWKGATTTPAVAGRLPVGPGEIALGRSTMDDLGVAIGDTVRSDAGNALIVVGETVIPMLDNAEPGHGAIMTGAGLKRHAATDGSRYLLLTYAPGTDPAIVEHRLEVDYGVEFTVYSRPDAPGRLQQLDLMRGLLHGLAAFLIGLGIVGLVHFLAVSIRRRRHEFAVLRSLGFVRRDVSLTMSWQAISITAVGVIAGVPLGVLIGRWAWLAAIGSVGMVDTPAVPLPTLAAVVVVSVGGAAALGAIPGWFAGRRPPADALRSE
jgi:predicted lysophospholipase L1 biosynthesis ABC-type transport system permease subunit